MTTKPRASELQRRKHARVRMRPNLVFSSQEEYGRTCYVIKDPVTLSYFRLDEGQRFAVGLMDGTRGLGEIQKIYEDRFRPERLPLEELEAFAAQLIDSGLAQNESSQGAELLFERWRKHRWETWRSAFANFLYIKIPLGNPDAFVTGLSRRVGFLFSSAGVLAGLTLVLMAASLVILRWHDFVTRLPSSREFFTPHTLLSLWLALGVAKLLHELGHGVCCKVHGGTVHEMGALLLLFSPTLYCNVSDSWTLRTRWQRMAVAAAGIYVDLLVATTATFVWWLAEPGTLVHSLCLGLMVVCGVSTLAWNGNPLMRFDGYYVFSDWLEVPNLADRSAHFLQAHFLRWLGADVAVEPAPGRGGVLLFVGYPIASYVYRVAVSAGVLCSLYTMLEPHKLGVVGLVVGTSAFLMVFLRPFYSVLRSLRSRGRLLEINPARVWLALGFLVLVLGAFFTIPVPVSVEGQAVLLVEPGQVHRIVAPDTGGFINEVLARDGQAVHTGDVLAVLSNPKLEINLFVNEADQALRSQQFGVGVARLGDGESAANPLAETLQKAEAELRLLAREHASLREQHNRLLLRAPRDGIVMGLKPLELRGKWLDKGAEVCRIANPGSLRAVLVIDPADHKVIAPGSHALVLVHGDGLTRRKGVVNDIGQADARNIPAQLSTHAGGEAATEQDPISKAEKPRNQSYLVSVRLLEPAATLQPGVLGRVKIEGPPQTGWWRLHRYLARTFGVGL